MSRRPAGGVRARMVPWLIQTGARITRPLTMGVRAVVLDGASRVFLVRHTYLPGWHLPGGGIETGETARAALAREVAEETGLTVRGDPVLHGVFLQRRRDHVVVYVVRDFEGIGDRPPDWEIAEARFHPVSTLPEGTGAPTRRRLREVLDGVPPAETW